LSTDDRSRRARPPAISGALETLMTRYSCQVYRLA